MERYCIECHDADIQKGKLDLASILDAPIIRHVATWERVVRKLNARQMPPLQKARPSNGGIRDVRVDLGFPVSIIMRNVTRTPGLQRTCAVSIEPNIKTRSGTCSD